MGWLTRSLAALAAFHALAAAGEPAPAGPERWTVYATRSGERALDGDVFGGNPFATALVQTLGEERGARSDAFSDLASDLQEKTIIYSAGRQRADVGAMPEGQSLLPSGLSVALVIVFADYGDEEGMSSLPGAAFDAQRVNFALRDAGYRSRVVVARSRAEYRIELDAFTKLSEKADSAVLYTTGHGMELDGEIWLLPPEYRVPGSSTLDAVRIADLQGNLRARRRKVVFYAGCRDSSFRPR